jgi:peptide/nickel transport system permease protein
MATTLPEDMTVPASGVGPGDDATTPETIGRWSKYDPVATALRPSTRKPKRWALWLAIGWLTLIVLMAVFADHLPLHPYAEFVPGLRARTGVGFRLHEPLGTDTIGRSMASRIAYGARQSLLIAVVATAIGVSVGILIGLAAGYLGSKVKETLNIGMEVFMAFPPLILLIAVASVGVRSATTIILGLAIVFAPVFGRGVRAQTLALADREFVLAARSMGATRLRIMFREILPNVLPFLIAVVFLVMGAAIIAEGSLSFLGFGVAPPTPSWGGMINEGRQYLQTAPHLVFVPAIFLVVTVVALRVVGEHLRTSFDAGESKLP